MTLYNLARVSGRRRSGNGGKVTKIAIPVERRPRLALLMELEFRLVPPLASRPSQPSDRRRPRLVRHDRLRIRRLSLHDRLLLRLLRLQLIIRTHLPAGD
ncbi:hypothetical protein SDJN03_08954, partial [Cucurbita argyrosperma subsp. sororia]